MEKMEHMFYKTRRNPGKQQDIIGYQYRSLCTGIFQQAVFDATNKRGTVANFISAYTWLLIAGYEFLTDILGMELDQSRYDNFIRQLKSGEYEMFKSIFSKKEVNI